MIRFLLASTVFTAVVSASTTQNPVLGFLDTGGMFTILEHPLATCSFCATVPAGINDLGQIVGFHEEEFPGGSHAFLYSGGGFTEIDDPLARAPGATLAYGINNAGQIVGCWSNLISNGFLYVSGNFTNIDRGPGTCATGINNEGQIVGETGGPGFLYSNGVFSTISDPFGSVGTFPRGINDGGEIVGNYANFDSGPIQVHGFLYSGGGFTTIDYPLAFDTWLTGINDAGQIVGYYTNILGDAHAFLYSGGTFTNIVDPDSPGSVDEALGINNAGQIVGTVGPEVLPEPSMFVAILLAVAWMANWLRKGHRRAGQRQ